MTVYNFSEYRKIDKNTYNKNLHDLKLMIHQSFLDYRRDLHRPLHYNIGQFDLIKHPASNKQTWLYNRASGNFIGAVHFNRYKDEILVRIRHNTIYRYELEQFIARKHDVKNWNIFSMPSTHLSMTETFKMEVERHIAVRTNNRQRTESDIRRTYDSRDTLVTTSDRNSGLNNSGNNHTADEYRYVIRELDEHMNTVLIPTVEMSPSGFLSTSSTAVSVNTMNQIRDA